MGIITVRPVAATADHDVITATGKGRLYVDEGEQCDRGKECHTHSHQTLNPRLFGHTHGC
jgi:hypothetical protein